MVLCYSRHRKVIRAPRKFLSLFKVSVIVPSPSLPPTVLTDTTRETCEFTCGSVSPSLLLLATLPSDHLATLCPSNLFSFHTATIHSASLPPELLSSLSFSPASAVVGQEVDGFAPAGTASWWWPCSRWSGAAWELASLPGTFALVALSFKKIFNYILYPHW